MAPFLRIAFNSYELGSLQAAGEPGQPFCAVKMKEALSTGGAGGWAIGQREALEGAGPCSPSTSGDPSPCRAQLWAQESRGH